MIIEVRQEDFDYARGECPDDAPWWMLQEFAANRALRRAFPEAEIIKVDSARMEVDDRRFHRSMQLYLRRGPYRFRLSRSKLQVRLYDVLHVLGWG
ncbi:MAG TPA: hypothetical protein VKB51_08505 [bacterium]|nr:hypothetical protein [bacterium]